MEYFTSKTLARNWRGVNIWGSGAGGGGCYLKFDSIAVVACIDCMDISKIKHLMQKENMRMLYLVEIFSRTLSVTIH